MVRTRLLALAALPAPSLLTALSAGRGIHSHLFVEPGKQFVLGSDQEGGFRLVAHNTGPVPVAVRQRLRAGTVAGRGALAPGQRIILRLAPGSAALVRNGSARRAELDLDISGGGPAA